MPSPSQSRRICSIALAFYFCLSLTAEGAPPPEVKTLIEQLRSKDESIRLKAAKELGKLKGRARDAIPALTYALQDSDDDVRAVAKKALAAIREDVGENELVDARFQELIKDLRGNDNKKRVAAIEKLGEFGPEAKVVGPVLVEFGMMHQSQAIREASSAAFERIDPLVHKEVLTFLIDEDPKQQDLAVASLHAMGPKARAAVPALKARYRFELVNGKGTRPNLKLLGALVAIAPSDPLIQREVLALVAGPEWDSGEGADGFRPTVMQFLNTMKIDNRQRFNALFQGLATARYHRTMIIREIGKLGVEARQALPVLMKLRFDPDAMVRDAANAAIESINEIKE